MIMKVAHESCLQQQFEQVHVGLVSESAAARATGPLNSRQVSRRASGEKQQRRWLQLRWVCAEVIRAAAGGPPAAEAVGDQASHFGFLDRAGHDEGQALGTKDLLNPAVRAIFTGCAQLFGAA